MIVGWALYYFLQSFQDPLPWKSCPVLEQSVTCKDDGCHVTHDNSRNFIQSWENIPWPSEECTLASSTTYF